MKSGNGNIGSGAPCQNCQAAGIICSFPVRDRNVVVSEAYLQQLQVAVRYPVERDLIPIIASSAGGPVVRETGHDANRSSTSQSNGDYEDRAGTMTLRHATTESFLSDIKKLSSNDHSICPNDPRVSSTSAEEPPSDESVEESSYDYVSLDFDTSCKHRHFTPFGRHADAAVGQTVSVQLPPYPYAIQLVAQFETFMAYEYHWYLRTEFRSTLEATYRYPDSVKSRSRIWLSKLLAVLALGESFTCYEPPLINVSQTDTEPNSNAQSRHTKKPYLPGVRFFEQALSLFKMPSEEPELEHVEALNLIVGIVGNMSAKMRLTFTRRFSAIL